MLYGYNNAISKPPISDKKVELERLGTIENKIAVFTTNGDDIDLSSGGTNINLITHVFNSVENKAIFGLPDKNMQCQHMTQFALDSVKFDYNYKEMWVSLYDKTRNSIAEDKAKGLDDFHLHCGTFHQVPVIYYDGNIYFFDFNNYFAKSEKQIKASVLIFPADQYYFEKLMQATGSEDGTIGSIGWKTLDSQRRPEFKNFIGTEDGRISAFNFLKSHNMVKEPEVAYKKTCK